MSTKHAIDEFVRNGKLPRAAVSIGLLAILVMATVSCNKTENEARIEQTGSVDKQDNRSEIDSEIDDQSPETAGQTESSRRTTSARFVSQELDQLSSPFTKETVLALNTIVARSLLAIERFDDVRRETIGIDLAERLKKYSAVSRVAMRARIDMETAGNRLRESGEEYNEAIFAAMVRFVDNVDDEIREEIERLKDSPTG